MGMRAGERRGAKYRKKKAFWRCFILILPDEAICMILLTYFLEKRKILFGDSTKFPSRSFFERHAKMHVEPAPLERQEVQRQVKIPDEWKSPPPNPVDRHFNHLVYVDGGRLICRAYSVCHSQRVIIGATSFVPFSNTGCQVQPVFLSVCNLCLTYPSKVIRFTELLPYITEFTEWGRRFFSGVE